MARETMSDPLSRLAPLLRVRPEIQYVCRFGPQWASPHAPEPDEWAPFHIVTGGACVLSLVRTGRSLTLERGDVVVLPHGSPHVMHGRATLPTSAGPFAIRSKANAAVLVKSNTDGEPDAELVCGRLRFDLASRNLLLCALPDAIIVPAAEHDDARRIGELVAMVKAELDAARPGAAAIAADLASALLVMVVRQHLEGQHASDATLSLMTDANAARAVAAMLDDPGRDWSLDALAALANMSRSSFVRTFRERAGSSPLAFLTELRLELARRMLLSSDQSISSVATEVGYQSESAFSRAFQERFGKRPGASREG